MEMGARSAENFLVAFYKMKNSYKGFYKGEWARAARKICYKAFYKEKNNQKELYTARAARKFQHFALSTNAHGARATRLAGDPQIVSQCAR